MKRIKKRGDWYHYVRRIPTALKEIDDRTFIQLGLKTKCPDLAEHRATLLDDYIEAYWADLATNGPDSDLAKYRKAVKLAKLHGIKYRAATEIANDSVEDAVMRIEAASRAGGDAAIVEAVLGGNSAFSSSLRYSECFELFEMHSRPQLLGKSGEQVRKWCNPRKRAIATFIDIIGDKPVSETSRDDILAIRDWWMERVETENIRHATVNKEIAQYLKGVLTTLTLHEDGVNIDISQLFANIRLPSQGSNGYPPFSDTFIANTLLNQSNLQGMNEDGRLLIAALVDTGARPREIITRQQSDIALDAEIPHIKIRPRPGEQGKTGDSKRDIPLVGAALYAFQKRPEGFLSYAGRVDSFTAAVNKFLRENDLLESQDHCLYSLRHSFQDRLIAHEVGERMQCELMGHKFDSRAKYGSGPTLEHKHRTLMKMAFKLIE